MDGWIAHWHSIIRGRDPPSFPPLWAFLFSPDHVMAYSVNVVKLHCLEMHRTDAYSFTRPKRWAPDLSDSIPSRAQTMTMAHMAAKAATAATAAAINCKMSLTSVVGERTKKKKKTKKKKRRTDIWQAHQALRKPDPVEPGSASLKTPSLGPSPSSTLNALQKIVQILCSLISMDILKFVSKNRWLFKIQWQDNLSSISICVTKLLTLY